MRIKELFSARDMTVGAPWRRLTEFAVPMLLGNLAQQLYNTVDSIVVGKYVGDNALAAVGSSAPVLNLLLAIFVGVATGAGIVISQRYGAGDRKGLSRAIGNCITLATIASVFMMIVGTLVTDPLLNLLDTPSEIIEWCSGYLKIYFLGAAGFTFYNILSGILRGLGDSFSALLFLLVAAGLNIVLDIWFVASFGMGVPGVALATVISQAISAILCFIKLLHMRDIFDLTPKMLRLHGDATSQILRLGIPSGITQGIMSLAMLVVQSLTNSMGPQIVACNVIIMRVDGFAMMPNMSFGQAMSVYTGQNVGAGRLDRVEQGLKQGTLMAVCFSTVITIFLLIFCKFFFGFFTNTRDVINTAATMMRIMSIGYIGTAITQVLGGVMRGAGDTMSPMWISLCTTVLLRIPVAYTIAFFTRCAEYPNGKPQALSFSLLLSWTMGAVISYIIYKRGGWRKKAKAAIGTASE